MRRATRAYPVPAVLGAALCLAPACTKKTEEKPAPKAAAPTQAKAPEPAKPAEPAAQGGATDPACVASWSPSGAAEKIEAAGHTFERTGTKLVETTKDADSDIVLGVMANVKENTPENLANLDAITAWFKTEKVQAIVVDGDLGDDQAQIEQVLDKIAGAGVPVFALIGNREGKTAWNAALAAAGKKHPGVFNMNQIRLAVLDDVALVSVPGYYNKVYIHSEDGCSYQPADVEATKQIAAAAGEVPVVLVSHGPPKQDGPEALDWTLESVNVGDPALATFIRDAKINFGIFANIHEAGGRATDAAGKTLVSQAKLHDQLFLNPGPVDAVRWKMNDGTESAGMAATMTISGKQASFKSFRVPTKG